MAVTLTTSYQLINEVLVGSAGPQVLRNYYVRLYAKYSRSESQQSNNQSRVYFEVRAVNNGTVYDTATGNWIGTFTGISSLSFNEYETVGYQEVLLSTFVSDLTHNNDGTKSFMVGMNNIDGPVQNAGATSMPQVECILPTIPRYATITSFSVSQRDETSVLYNFSCDVPVDYAWYSTDNGNTWHDLPINNVVSGLYRNTTYNFKLKVRRQDSQQTTISNTFTQTTYDYPKPTDTNNFIIGEGANITLYNPLGRTYTLELISNVSGNSMGSITTSYNGVLNAFKTNADQTNQYNSLTTTSSGTYYAKVTYETHTRTSGNKTYTISSNVKPTISGTIVDNNQDTIDLTNDSSKIIKGYSTALITPSFIASSSLDTNATIIEKKVNNNTFTTSTVTILNAQNSVFSIYAKNNHQISNTTNVGDSSKLIPYFKPTFNSDSLFFRLSPVGTQMKVKFDGNSFNKYFDVDETNFNTITISWKVKLSGSTGDYVEGGTFTLDEDYTIDNDSNTFASIGNGILIDNPLDESGEWNYLQKYDFQLKVEDSLDYGEYNFSIGKGIPVFNFWEDNDGNNLFNVNGTYLVNNIPLLNDFSTNEVKLPIKSKSGKPIYIRTYTGNVPDTQNTWVNIFKVNGDVKDLIYFYGTITNTKNDGRVLDINSYESSSYNIVTSYLGNTDYMQMRVVGWTYSTFGFIYEITCLYTKTTD